MGSSPPGRPGRLVFSTERRDVCAGCGWPAAECRCSSRLRSAEPVPEPGRRVAKLRLERSGRSGKTVTVVDGLPRNPAFLADLAAQLKRACGTGGTATESTVEVQGDHRARLRSVLASLGFQVKG